jgi:hypothetical protein
LNVLSFAANFKRSRPKDRAALLGVDEMTLDRAVMAFAGGMVLLSVLLTAYVSPYFLWFTVFIGVNLIQSAFTGFCPAAMVFRKLGLRPGTAF